MKVSQRTQWFWETKLMQKPQTYAIMQPPGSKQKYIRVNEPPTIEIVQKHLLGKMTIAVPTVVEGRAHEIIFDVDAGGQPVLQTLLEIARTVGLYCYGLSTPRRGGGQREIDQRGYVYIPFDGLVKAEHLHQVGEHIRNLAMLMHPESRIENRVNQADTRVFFGRHTHTEEYGCLLMQNPTYPQLHIGLNIDRETTSSFDQWQKGYRPNPIACLGIEEPEGGGQSCVARHRSVNTRTNGGGIDEFNQANDIRAILEQAGARRMGNMYFCPFHDDNHASLTVFRSRAGKLVARCLSEHSACPLSGRPHDAFDVYCLAHGLDTSAALKQVQVPPPSGSSSPKRAYSINQVYAFRNRRTHNAS